MAEDKPYRKLNIKITGEMGSGKSFAAELIRKCLERYGYAVFIDHPKERKKSKLVTARNKYICNIRTVICECKCDVSNG